MSGLNDAILDGGAKLLLQGQKYLWNKLLFDRDFGIRIHIFQTNEAYKKTSPKAQKSQSFSQPEIDILNAKSKRRKKTSGGGDKKPAAATTTTRTHSKVDLINPSYFSAGHKYNKVRFGRCRIEKRVDKQPYIRMWMRHLRNDEKLVAKKSSSPLNTARNRIETTSRDRFGGQRNFFARSFRSNDEAPTLMRNAIPAAHCLLNIEWTTTAYPAMGNRSSRYVCVCAHIEGLNPIIDFFPSFVSC